MIQNWRPHFERQRVGPWFLRRQCNVAKNCAGDVTWQRTSFGGFLYNPIIMILVLVSCWAYHIKVCAFHCFSLCASACPLIPVHLCFSSLYLRFASPLFHSFLPSPLSTYKGERRRKGVKQVESCGWKGRWKGWIRLERLGEDDARVMRGWSEVGAMVE